MKILIEGHKYPTELVEQFIDGLHLDNIVQRKDGIIFNYVGYFYCSNNDVNDIVIILPKVFIFNENSESESDSDLNGNSNIGSFSAFGKYKAEEIIDFRCNPKLKEDYIFIDRISTWIYLTIHKYADRNPNSKACIRSLSRLESNNYGRNAIVTLMDAILGLKQFAEENKDFYTFILVNSHMGQNKINWHKTINSSTAYIQDGFPVYLSPVTRHKVVNFNENLLIIFFTLLEDLNKTYGIDAYIDERYQKMGKFDFQMFKQSACNHLQSIKRNYYTDITVRLWNLLFSYFSIEHEIKAGKRKNDLLLISNFNVVFEDMIDYIISDDNYPKELKEQLDGKIIDHIYKEKSLIYNYDIYYVGDSKYYKQGREIESKSIHKQYTYAKNIIQRNIEIFHGYVTKTNKEGYLDYRDSITEGYNITPNFFISGTVTKIKENDKDTYDLKNPNLILYDDEYKSIQFTNRLFDRDTLILQRYNINFLYVLSLYISKGNSDKESFKSMVKIVFRNNLIKYLNNKYLFYIIDPNPLSIEQFVKANFWYMRGQLFSYEKEEGRVLLFSVEKGNEFHDAANLRIETNTLFIDNQPYSIEKFILT